MADGGPGAPKVHLDRIALLVGYLVAVVGLMFVVPEVGWTLFALTVLAVGALVNPTKKRPRGRGHDLFRGPPPPG